MAAALQIICAVLIIAAAVFYVYTSHKHKGSETRVQMVLSVFQILLCGWFFALCISDVLDIRVNFSYVRLILNIVYAAAFLTLTINVLFNRYKESSSYFKSILFAYIVLIVLQCFVFPYESQDVVLRIFETLEGAVVFGLLVAILFKLEDASFASSGLIIATVLELLIAIGNVVVPFSSVTNDFQSVDIPLNYAALFMRPVLFASLTLSYRVWLNRRNRMEWVSKENCFYKLLQIFIRPYSAGAQLVEGRDMTTSVLATGLHILSSGAFFYLLVSKTDGLIQSLVSRLHDGTGTMLNNLSETVLNFLRDTVLTWIGKIPLIGDAVAEPAQTFANEGISSLTEEGQTLVNTFFQDFSDALRLPSLAAFALSALIAALLILFLILIIWALLKITKHKWCSLRGAFCLSAVRSTVTIPFAIVSAILACINPLYGILLFAFAIFWSMGHMYTTIMAGADKTSGNRFAGWFPVVLILMYLLTAAVLFAIIALALITLYYQLSEMANVYISYITALTGG